MKLIVQFPLASFITNLISPICQSRLFYEYLCTACLPQFPKIIGCTDMPLSRLINSLQIVNGYESKNQENTEISPDFATNLKKKQILEHRTMKLQPYIWRFIVNDIAQEMLDRNDDLLLKLFQQV
jgi:hypothetical protein